MRTKWYLLVAFGIALIGGSVRAEDTNAREIVTKAIEAHGGEAELKKLENSSVKSKGTVQAMGLEIAFTGEAMRAGADRRRMDLEMEVMNQKIRLLSIFDKDKGWVKINDMVVDLDKDKIEEATEQGHVQEVTGLLPLKSKDYSLSVVGDDKVGDAAVTVIRVERKGHRDVSLSFDKKTLLLLKSETRVKDDQTGQEVTQETFFTDYNDKGLRQAKKVTLKRDGKVFVEAEVTELNVDQKFDDSTFAKP